jgi:hypothetical protein
MALLRAAKHGLMLTGPVSIARRLSHYYATNRPWQEASVKLHERLAIGQRCAMNAADKLNRSLGHLRLISKSLNTERVFRFTCYIRPK